MKLYSCFGFSSKRKRNKAGDNTSDEKGPPGQDQCQNGHLLVQNTIKDTPLLALPTEIRLMIFELIVGSPYVLHIMARSNLLYHSKCCDLSVNEIGRCDDIQQDDETIPPVETVQPPKFRSHTSALCYCEDDEPPVSAINLLQSCRQIYVESIDLLYSLNTFEFSHCETFIWFSRTVTAERLALIKSLHVGFFPEKDFRPHWSFLAHNLWFRMCNIIVLQMPGLRSLHISLRDWEISELQRQDRLLRPLASLRGLQQLSIEVAEVTGPNRHQAVHISPFARTLKMQALQSKD
jgi:hypothetical protein